MRVYATAPTMTAKVTAKIGSARAVCCFSACASDVATIASPRAVNTASMSESDRRCQRSQTPAALFRHARRRLLTETQAPHDDQI